MTKEKRYRLYIDESGDHAYGSFSSSSKRFLGLLGVIFEVDYYIKNFFQFFEQFKQKHFPHNPDDPVILHQVDIAYTRGHFKVLLSSQKRNEFNSDLLNLLKTFDYRLICVVIDKKAHWERYEKAAFHPYHYCLVTMLERYCGFLSFYNAKGDVMAESRGAKEDKELKRAYTEVYENGTQFRDSHFFQNALTSKEIKLKPKTANIAGLQLADILARTCKNEILLENQIIENIKDFGMQICNAIEDKYNRNLYSGRVNGYGKIYIG